MNRSAWGKLGGRNSKETVCGGSDAIVVAFLRMSALLAWAWPAEAGAAEIHYAPVENLEHIDVERIGSARVKIDLAADSD